MRPFGGTGPNDVWGARNDGAYLGHWDGNTWSHVASVSGGIIAGGAPGDFWHPGGRGPGGEFELGVGTTADACPLVGDTSAQVYPVSTGWGSATDDVWFVGVHAFHFDGASWTCTPLPTTNLLQGIDGTSRVDVWAVGVGGVVLHYDGATWSLIPSPTSNDLYGVWESGPCDVWAIGDAVYHAHPVDAPSDL